LLLFVFRRRRDGKSLAELAFLNQLHSALGAFARRILDYLRVHRAGVSGSVVAAVRTFASSYPDDQAESQKC